MYKYTPKSPIIMKESDLGIYNPNTFSPLYLKQQQSDLNNN